MSQVFAAPSEPAPGSIEYWKRELANQHFGFGNLREQRATPGFGAAVNAERFRLKALWRDESYGAFKGRPRFTLALTGIDFLLGAPWRNETLWAGSHERIHVLNRWGAKLTADLWGPPDLFTAGERRPVVVITTGSIQANARMYFWAAQTLAEAGYVAITYDVQGQGESETFGHRDTGQIWCGAVDQSDLPVFLREIGPCPGFPFQQPANFGGGAVGMHNFALSTPQDPWEHHSAGTGTAPFNPWHEYVDGTRVGAAGHSFGAAAVSFLQAHPELLREPVKAIVAWDGLSTCQTRSDCQPSNVNAPLVPALDLRNDYFFAWLTILSPPNPQNSLDAFDHWREAGVDTATIALRGGTHMEYTSVPNNILGATRYGQDLAAHYTLAWFDRYLRDDPSASERLLAREVTFTHIDPVGRPDPEVTTLAVSDFASFYNRSGVFVDGTCRRDWKHDTEIC